MRYFKKFVKEGIYANERNGFVASMFGATGFLSFYILHLLSKEPLCGEEIRNLIHKATGKIWKPNPGFIYPVLKEMRKENLIKGEWNLEGKHPRRVYEITEKGKSQYEKIYKIVKIKFDDFRYITEKIQKEVFDERSNNSG